MNRNQDPRVLISNRRLVGLAAIAAGTAAALLLAPAAGGQPAGPIGPGPIRPGPIVRGPIVRGPIVGGQIGTLRLLPGRIIGSLVLDASVGNTPTGGAIELPDIPVTARLFGSAIVVNGTTALDGSFDFTVPRRGIYQVCWKLPDGVGGCSGRIIVGPATAWAGRIVTKSERGAITGTVLTGDGRPCWIDDSFFGLNVATKVSAGNSSVRANTQGEYAIFGVGTRTRVNARCEGAAISGVGEPGAPLLLRFTNRAPRIAGLTVTDTSSGAIARRPAPSATLRLRSQVADADNDPIEYRWRVGSEDGGLSPADSEAKWQLPDSAATRTAYLMARDGKGGFAFRRFVVKAGETRVDFSGVVRDETGGAPIVGADVAVAGVSAKTDARGWFALSAPPLASERYVLNIERPGFARISRVADKSVMGATYEMIRAQVAPLPNSGLVTITDTRSSGFCGGRDERQAATHNVPKLLRRAGLTVDAGDTLVLRDDRGADPAVVKRALEAARRFQQAACKPMAAEIAIDGADLVGADGRAANGPITAATATLNPARRALVGDYRAIQAGGEEAELLSFGAVYAEFRDSTGRQLQLKPGATAELKIPVPPSQAPDATPTVPLWTYDAKDGRWREEGTANLQSTPAGPFYVGKTSHFSEINMDVAGTDPAFATCVRFHRAPGSFAGWSNLVLRAYVSFGGNSVQVKETPLDGADYHAIYRIPFATGTPNTLRVEVRGTFSGQAVVLLDNIINTDARPKMTGTDLWPPYPYEPCGAAVELSEAPGVVPAYANQDAAGRPYFLIGPGGTRFNPVDGEAAATAYYAAIDPANAKTTLGQWWAANGFAAADGSSGESSFTRASYMNHNDLGFGRDMNCHTRSGGRLACFVTNYGLPDQNPQNADDAEARNAVTRAATVVMEFDPAATAGENVQFYVFGGGVTGSPRLKFADLDGFGPKAVPYLCLVCHGGTVNAANKAQHARFREFDLPSFRYSANRSWDHSGALSNTLSNPELTAFARLNQQVRATTSNKRIGALIDAWYPGGFGGAPKPVLPAPPAGWSSDAAGYHNVYGKTCRTCHIARDDAANLVDAAYFTFDQRSNFASTSYAVCGGNKVMPNAVITYKNLWADTPRVTQYEVITGVTLGTCRNN
jgi:hypothetical protein